MREDKSGADFNSLGAASRASAKWKRPTARVGESQTAAGSHGVGRLSPAATKVFFKPESSQAKKNLAGS